MVQVIAETTDVEVGSSGTVMTSTPLLIGTEPETPEPLFRQGTCVTLASGQPARYQRREPRVLHLWTAAQRLHFYLYPLHTLDNLSKLSFRRSSYI